MPLLLLTLNERSQSPPGAAAVSVTQNGVLTSTVGGGGGEVSSHHASPAVVRFCGDALASHCTEEVSLHIKVTYLNHMEGVLTWEVPLPQKMVSLQICASCCTGECWKGSWTCLCMREVSLPHSARGRCPYPTLHRGGVLPLCCVLSRVLPCQRLSVVVRRCTYSLVGCRAPDSPSPHCGSAAPLPYKGIQCKLLVLCFL